MSQRQPTDAPGHPAYALHPAYARMSENEARARNQAARALLEEWRGDLSGYEEDNADAIERALAPAPLSLREYGSK